MRPTSMSLKFFTGSTDQEFNLHLLSSVCQETHNPAVYNESITSQPFLLHELDNMVKEYGESRELIHPNEESGVTPPF